MASTIAPDLWPVKPSLGATVNLELGSTSASAPPQNTAPTGDRLGTVVNPNLAGTIVATTDTKVGPAIASSSVTNVGSALTTSGPAANVGTRLLFPVLLLMSALLLRFLVWPITSALLSLLAQQLLFLVWPQLLAFLVLFVARLLMPALLLPLLLLVLLPQFLQLSSLLLL